MNRLLLSSLLALAVLMGCQSALSSGTVVDRSFEPAHQDYRYRTVMKYTYGCGGINMDGKAGGCGYGFHPSSERYLALIPDQWFIEITDGARRDWLLVTQDAYDSYTEGETYP